MKIFEMGMLLCFGVSWPVSLWKSFTSRTTKGKSVFFLILILIGYLSGLVYKVSSGFDYVSWFYILNASMVFADILMYVRNRRFEQRLEPGRAE